MQLLGAGATAEEGCEGHQGCLSLPDTAVVASQMAPSVDSVLGDKDLLKSIFDQLDLQEVCRAAVTCQLWYQVCTCSTW